MLHGTKMRNSWFSTQGKGFDARHEEKNKNKALMLVSWTYSTSNPIFNTRAGNEPKNEDRHFVLAGNQPCGIFNSSSVSADLALTLQCFHNFREFSHWKVNSLATEKRDFLKAPLPLAPEFLRNLRLLGRRPTLQQINENLIKKYGTHFLVSATLGGKKWHGGLLICNLQRSRAKKTEELLIRGKEAREEESLSSAEVAS